MALNKGYRCKRSDLWHHVGLDVDNNCVLFDLEFAER
jgi:hypothetical protein